MHLGWSITSIQKISVVTILFLWSSKSSGKSSHYKYHLLLQLQNNISFFSSKPSHFSLENKLLLGKKRDNLISFIINLKLFKIFLNFISNFFNNLYYNILKESVKDFIMMTFGILRRCHLLGGFSYILKLFYLFLLFSLKILVRFIFLV